MAAKIIEAVTAVLICDGEIYVTRRQVHLTSFPGFHAFAGGKVDQTELETPFAHPLLQGHSPRLVHALFRELREELGFDLEIAFNEGNAVSFDEMGIALTPPFAPVRFNTHFFRVELRQRPEIRLEISEIESGEWVLPASLMETYERGELLVAPPTQAVIRTLASDISATAIGAFRDYTDSEIPVFEAVCGVRHYFVFSNTLPPADRTNCFLLGDMDAHRILVDPSPRSVDELDRLCSQIAATGIHEVFLTHHHPDHCEYANDLARRFGVPIAMSLDTETRIRKRAPTFFDGLEVRHYADGDVVTRWLGQPLRVIAVPGHDEGQLALMPDSRAFCIVGDLIQGVGTVVISPPEGNMAKYFATLDKVIALKPRVIYPSHGTALGGTFYLEQTLKHRSAREAQVKTLFMAGKTVDEMLAEMYVGTDPRLMPLARINIEGHLNKLREEGALAA